MSGFMRDDVQQSIGLAIARAPEWVKRDLLSKEPALRERAEEALAAMIAAALTHEKSHVLSGAS
jgi:hypothetical protein